MDYFMIDFASSFLGWRFAIVTLLCLGLSLVLPRRAHSKAVAATLVLAVLFLWAASNYPMYREARQKLAELEQLANGAEQLFTERCKSAGFKIHETVEDVEGFLLINVRPEGANHSAQYDYSDPYGKDFGGDAYIRSMLTSRRSDDIGKRSDSIGGYRYVVVKSVEGRYFKVTLGDQKNQVGEIELKREPATNMPRYGVRYQDISTQNDRKHWIAGSRLEVVDMNTGSAIAERVGYMRDRGMGSQEGDRSPWLFAAVHACPAFPLLHDRYPQQVGQTRRFVEHPSSTPTVVSV